MKKTEEQEFAKKVVKFLHSESFNNLAKELWAEHPNNPLNKTKSEQVVKDVEPNPNKESK